MGENSDTSKSEISDENESLQLSEREPEITAVYLKWNTTTLCIIAM